MATPIYDENGIAFILGDTGGTSGVGDIVAYGGTGGKARYGQKYVSSGGSGGGYGSSGNNMIVRSGNAGGKDMDSHGSHHTYGGTGWGLSGSPVQGNYGKGGDAWGGFKHSGSDSVACGGGSGGFCKGKIYVTPGQTIAISVGGGGARRNESYVWKGEEESSWGGDTSAGNAGFVVLEWGNGVS